MPEVIEAIRAGKPVVLPTDTVYGLCTTPYRSEATERLYRLKGRGATQPTAVIATDVDFLFELVPELHGRLATILRTLLPGPYTLVVSRQSSPITAYAGSSGNADGGTSYGLSPCTAPIRP